MNRLNQHWVHQTFPCWRVICALILLATPWAAHASDLPFDIDGDVPGADCQSSTCIEFQDPFGSEKELGATNGSDTKLGSIHLASPPMLDFTNPNGSTDIVNIWLKTDIDEHGNVWLYFAWERDANTGSSVVSYEFQQAAMTSACDYSLTDGVEPEDADESELIAGCNPWSGRQQDDFQIVWDFNGGATDIILRTFDGTVFDAGVNLTAGGDAIASLNSDWSRGEGAVNLSAAIWDQLTSCQSFANIIAGTITGNSDQADYKDTVLATAGNLNVSNCGRVRVTKLTDPSGEQGVFGYTLRQLDDGAIDYSPRSAATDTLVDHNDSDLIKNLIPDTDYTLTEDTYPTHFQMQSIVCNKPVPDTSGAQFSVNVAETTDCVITNEVGTGTLTVVKTVNNRYGGTAKSSDFCISLGDVGLTVDPGMDEPGRKYSFLHDYQYNVDEVACDAPAAIPAGYTASFSGDCKSGKIVAFTDKKCTITNSDQKPSLTLVKKVTNDSGGTAKPEDWTLTAAGPVTVSGAGGASSGNDFQAGTYTLSESGPAGYTASAWTCTNGIEVSSQNQIRIDLGQSTTCTITNDDIQPTLTLVKTVNNNYGGTLGVSDFPLFINGNAATSGQAVSLDAGNYTASETQQSGYSAGDWGGDCAADGTVTLSVGDNKTCTITNSDIQPTLTLVKTVNNNYGGTLGVSDFPLAISGTSAVSGQAYGLNAGDYLASEQQQFGYSTAGWGGDCDADGNVTLSVGDNKTCTITNSDLQPTLTLVKTVNNNYRGTLGVSDFPLFINGTPATSDVAVPLSAGSYTASETQQAGYTAGDWGGDCDADGNVSLSVGQNKTCTITNSDIQPTLTLVKTVDNNYGGTLGVSDFPLFINGTAATSDVAVPLSAGSYTASETQQAGYTAGDWGGDCDADGNVSLSVGQNKTCTLTNTDIPPRLRIVKTPDSAMVSPGSTAEFTIRVYNDGGGDALGVTLTDTLPSPSGFTALSWTHNKTPECTIANDGFSLSCNIGTLAKDPTPGTTPSGDEPYFEVKVSTMVPADYFAASITPGGSGTLGSNFEIDGNMVQEVGEPGLIDWDTTAFDLQALGLDSSSVIHMPDPPGADLSPEFMTDSAFGKGAKENDPAPSVVDSSVPPNKSDLTDFLIRENEVDGNVFLALAWLRVNSLGTSNFDFELNQSNEMSANGFTPLRQIGDVLISFDFDSGGDLVTLTLREWDGTTWVNPQDLVSVGSAEGAVNDPATFGTTPNGEQNPMTGEALLDNTFGEAVINLTQTFGSGCRTFASAYVKGRSSTSFTSALKDFILPVDNNINSCQQVPLPNIATADATNPGQDPVSDTGSISIVEDLGSTP